MWRISCLFIVTGRENKRPVCLFPNRDNVLLSIDPFDPMLPNWNGLVIGSSGAGKSFTLLQLVLMFYGQHPTPKIVWLDNGASSRNIIDCLDGQFVELNLDSKICLNPFNLIRGKRSLRPLRLSSCWRSSRISARRMIRLVYQSSKNPY